MRKIIVDLNRVRDNDFEIMYELFGLDVQNKSYEDFEEECFKCRLRQLLK